MDSLRLADPIVKRELWQSIRSGVGGRVLVTRRTQFNPTVAERQLLELILSDPDFRHEILARVEPDDYEGLASAPIFRALIAADRNNENCDYDYLANALAEDPVAELLPSLLISEFEEADDQARRLSGERCLETLRLMKVERRISELASEIAAAERNGETELCDQLTMEHLELTRRRSNLLPKAEAYTAT